jgi:glycosyltransferase involved in cell wall biosynthesis
MRILVLSHNYPRHPGDPAGAFVARLAEAAQSRGDEVRVLAPHAAGLPVLSIESGVRVRRFRYAPERFERVAYRGDLHRQSPLSPVIALGVPLFLSAFARAAHEESNALHPDVVHAHWWLPGGRVAAMLGVPYVVTCHGSDVRMLRKSALMRRVARPVFAAAGKISTVSRFLANDLQKLFPDLGLRPQVTPMPVDLDRFAEGRVVPKADPPQILFAGNLIESKGVDLLIEAFAELRNAGVPCQLRILGEGPYRPKLVQLTKTLGVADAVTWLGWISQDHMPAEYGASTVTVLPTRGDEEGLGLVLVEALAAGSAIVGTPAGGIPEVIEHEVTGLLTKRDDAADLARQLRRVLEDADLRRKLIEAGQQRIRAAYAPDAAAARFAQIYDAVAGYRHAA